MTKVPKASRRPEEWPPDPKDHTAFRNWLEERPFGWSTTIAVRSALRVLPFARAHNLASITLPLFRAVAIARFAAKYPNFQIGSLFAGVAAEAAFNANACAAYAVKSTGSAAYAASDAAYTAYAGLASAGYATNAVVSSARAHDAVGDAVYSAVRFDVQQLHNSAQTADDLARRPLWLVPAPTHVADAWRSLREELRGLGDHWEVWIDWYENVLLDESRRRTTEGEDAAFTDIPSKLPWEVGAERVNDEIARRLREIPQQVAAIPDQSPAPVRVEERNGKVVQRSNQGGQLNAAERDFTDWRDPVLDHIGELMVTDFAAGTNHARMRDRLTALQRLLPGEIVEVKERQFRIGYEIERLDGLLAAYRSGGDDMPALNAAQLQDLEKLRVTLRIGIGKLDRWVEFAKKAGESPVGVDADQEVVAATLEDMAAWMAQKPQYFDPELPTSFRFLAEAVRDPLGATKTVVYGAVKSAENLISFLGQRALGIAKKTADAIEANVSKALLIGLSGAALSLSGALSQGWAWLKPLLAAIAAGG